MRAFGELIGMTIFCFVLVVVSIFAARCSEKEPDFATVREKTYDGIVELVTENNNEYRWMRVDDYWIESGSKGNYSGIVKVKSFVKSHRMTLGLKYEEYVDSTTVYYNTSARYDGKNYKLRYE